MKIEITLLSLALLMVGSIEAQIYSPNATDRMQIDGDSVYMFKQLGEAELVAQATGSSSITWYKYNTDGTQEIIKPKEENIDKSSIGLTSEGCYKAEIVTDEKTKTYTAWCYSPKIDSVAMEIDSITCSGLYARAKAFGESIHIDNGTNTHEIRQRFIYNWYIGDTLALTTNVEDIVLESPMSNGEIRVMVSNQAERERTKRDSVSSWGVKAIFQHKVREHDIPHEVTKGDAISSPSEIEFTNTSLGDYTVCEWQMGNVTRLFEENPVYTFQTSGKYRIALIVTNENSGCSSVDSTLEVTITESEIDFPNTFTPNGDEVNDEFRPSYKSIKSYTISIYNRWGRKVYESRDITKGWDGKNGNSDCAEGVYMYVAEAEGFDKGVKFTRKGSVTLVR